MKHTIFSCLFVVLSCLCCSESTKTNEHVNQKLYDYNIESHLREMGVELPVMKKPLANYVHAVKSGNLVFLAGKGPRDQEGNIIKGKLGKDISVDEAYKAARNVAISQLGALKSEIGDLNKVVRVVKVFGMVNATDDFGNQPEVINGFSDFIVEVFGERGKHARAAVGMCSLPRNMVCEIEMIVEVQN